MTQLGAGEVEHAAAFAVDGSSKVSKSRLVYSVDGKRVVGYDNERGKGDHRHLNGVEMRCFIKDVPTLLRDFLQDVKEANNEGA